MADEAIRIVPKPNPTVADLGELRQLCALGLSEIRAAAAAGTPIRELCIFGSEWQEDRVRLRGLADKLAAGAAPFMAMDTESGEAMTAEGLRTRMAFWRGIELEQQRASDLENGFIANIDEFQPHDDDWTSSDLG